jgi:hypothetical protein
MTWLKQRKFSIQYSAFSMLLGFDRPQRFHQFFHHPVRSACFETIGCRAMLPDGVADSLKRAGAQGRLSQEAGEIT